MMLTMADSTDVADLPDGMGAYGGYVGGRWPTYQTVVQRFPGVPVLSIAVSSDEDADCLDIESGDATIADAPAWFARQRAREVARPALYTSVSNVAGLVPVLSSAGIVRGAYRLWTAHYKGQHVCSPSCYPGMPTTADGTQWIDHGGWDESLLSDDFFDQSPTPGDDMPNPNDVVASWSVPGSAASTYVDLHADGGLFGYGGFDDAQFEYVASANDGDRYHFGPNVTPGVISYPGLPANERSGTRHFTAMTPLAYQGRAISGVGPEGPAGPTGPAGPPGSGADVSAINQRLVAAGKALAGA